jgi:sarcosine oxidase
LAEQFRAVVVGCGAVGAATAYWLSRRLGDDVLVLEQYELGHSRGASEDHSRVIRHAYSRPEYTALTPAAYQSWGLVEQATGIRLLHRTGGLTIAASGTTGASWLGDIAAAMTIHNLPYEELSGDDVATWWPQWRVDSRHQALFDPESGILNIRRATAALVALARNNGATIVQHAPVEALEEAGSGVSVVAAGSIYHAETLVLCGGAWNPLLLKMLGTELPITLTEEQVTYFATTKVREFTLDRFPIYGFIDDDDLYYGFPVYGEVATKAALDSSGPVVTPETRSFRPDPERVEKVRYFLKRYLPGALGPELYSRVCYYDLPPDRDFVVDYVPGHERVLVSAGAGHAGKFAALLGRVLSELALDGQSRFPVEAFRADRPAMTESVSAGSVRSNSL